jgi:RNA polymerase sigma-70 factor (ECF subfamily)
MQCAGSSGGDSQRMEQLVRAVACGDPLALASVYEQTAGEVFSIARAILGSVEDAEEVVCDVYTYAWQHARTYDGTRGTVLAWLAIITKSRAIDRRRQRREEVSLDDERQEALAGALIDERPDPEKMLRQIQIAGAVRSAVESLNPQRRRLIDLAFFQGLSHQELADASGLCLGTVKSHLRRALAALQRQLTADL